MGQKAKDHRPARARYNNERRWEKNKARRIKRQERIEEKERLNKEGKHGAGNEVLHTETKEQDTD